MRIDKSSTGALSTLVIVGLLLASLLAACSSQPGAIQKPKSVKIGAILPMTGPLAPFGETSKRGLQLVVDEVNASGGIKSLGGATIELIFADTQTQPDKAVGLAEQLISESKVDLLTGALQSAATIASSQVAERMKTPYVIATSTADQQTERGFKYIFQVSGKNDWLGRDQVEFLDYLGQVNGKKLSKVGLLYEDSDYGQTVARAHKKYLQSKGYNIVAEVSYPAQTPEMDSFVLKLKAGNPDVILPASYPGDAILFVKTMNKLGIQVPIVGSGAGYTDAGFVSALGPLGNGIMTIDVWSEAVPAAKSMAEKYRAKYSSEPDAQVATNYQTAFTIVEALEKAGSVDKEAIRKALSEVSLTGSKIVLPIDKVQFDSNGQNAFHFVIAQIKNGKFVPVWPEKFAMDKVVLTK